MAKQSATHSILGNNAPMVVFAILTFGGAAFIITAKLWNLNILVVTGIPIAIMLTYLVLSLVAEGLRLHNEQAGDNLYYMGFLFTLTSLGVSLYRFADETSIDQIVQNFGIAVSSTICGIALRIFFNQMRRDPIDIERSVRHELAEMTRRVRSELDSSAREFSSYRRTSSQMLLEGFEEIARQAEQTGAAVQEAIETLSKESIKPIQEASEQLAVISNKNVELFEERANKLTELSEDAFQKLNQTSAKVSEFADQFGEAIEKVSNKMELMKSPDDILRIELKPAIEAIRDTSDLQKRLSEEGAARLDRHADETIKTLQPLSEMPDKLNEALGPIRTLPGVIQEALQPVSTAAQDLANSMNELRNATIALSQTTQAPKVPATVSRQRDVAAGASTTPDLFAMSQLDVRPEQSSQTTVGVTHPVETPTAPAEPPPSASADVENTAASPTATDGVRSKKGRLWPW
jgi:hypothetical protein